MQHRALLRQVGNLTGKWLLPNLDHMKKLPPRGFSDTMNPQEKKKERR
jgi:hypothetical protein